MSRTSASTVPTVYDVHGRPVALGRTLGRGGEASVFVVPATPGTVAKVYHTLPERSRAQKLEAMASLAGHDLVRIAAWPTGTLHIRPRGEIAGLLMPRVDGHRELHVLYSPAQRRQTFPKAGWDFLIHVALNLARAFAVVHAAGHVVGDVNQKNVVVSEEGLVRLLDCDSFQINSAGRQFPCEVGVPEFTPPELHGQSFKSVVRTQNHDRFGLAILIFHILFMGRHPFAGVYRKGRADMPTERAIREGRYVYSTRAAQFEMEAPPHALPPAAGATAEVADLFERAFARQGSVPPRPSAGEWVAALSRMKRELRKCQVHRGHVFIGISCPWCAIERAGGHDFFLTLAAVSGVPGARGATIWSLDDLLRRASAIPAPPGTLTSLLRSPPAKAGVRSQAKGSPGATALALLFYAVAVLSFFGMFEAGVLFFVMIAAIIAGNAMREKSHPKVDPPLLDALERSTQAHNALLSEWARDVDTPTKKFAEALKGLDEKQRRYRNLPSEHQQARLDLSRNQRQFQLKRHLEKFYIRNARIDGVGTGLKQTLLSFGIETAADITPGAVYSIPGFGPTRTAALVAWRQAVESKFVFNPNRAVDPADLADVDRRFAAMRTKLEQEMENLLAEMRSHSIRATGAAQRLNAEISRTANALSLAKARAGKR